MRLPAVHVEILLCLRQEDLRAAQTVFIESGRWEVTAQSIVHLVERLGDYAEHALRLRRPLRTRLILKLCLICPHTSAGTRILSISPATRVRPVTGPPGHAARHWAHCFGHRHSCWPRRTSSLHELEFQVWRIQVDLVRI